MFESLVVYFGVVSTIWIVVGIALVGKLYRGYSHSKQFCSELGACGSPTEKISPIVNNYPLGLLFCLFGLYIAHLSDVPFIVNISGWLIVTHGMGTWIAGYFPMDADPYTKEPSYNCKVHSLAGLIMFLSLLVASTLIAVSPTNGVITPGFRVFSLACALVSVYFAITLTKAFKNQTNPGLHQRIGYGAQLIWLSGLSLALV